MQPRDFCYWLQGFMELNGMPADGMSTEQCEIIARHLKLVLMESVTVHGQPATWDQEAFRKAMEGTGGIPASQIIPGRMYC